MTEAVAPRPEDACEFLNTAASSAQEAFTPDQEAEFHAADRQAGTMVAGLMLAIFLAAVVMYSFICFVAMGG